MKYAISGGHEATVEVAEEILLSGGNAYDAAVAAYLVSFISEPSMASAGAGGLALIHTKDGYQTSLDFFCQTPRTKQIPSAKSFYPIDIDFGEAKERFYIGIGAAATPGAIAGIFHLNKKYGTMPLSELAQPAIKYAKEGIRLNEFQAYDFHLLRDIMCATDDARAIFCKGNRIMKKGDFVKMPQYADFLDSLCKEGSDLFYKGEVAKSIVDLCASNGGNLSMQDFGNYSVAERPPLQYPLPNGDSILTASRPSVGGAILLSFLNQLVLDGENGITSLINAYKHTLPLTKDLNALALEIKKLTHSTPSFHGPKKYTGTSHFNIVDKDGNAISLSTTIGEGCGEFIPNTDMQMNNMLGELALLPNGLHSWEANKRLISMMAPSLISDSNGKLRAALGTGGAGRIPFMIGQVIHKLIRGMDIKAAIVSPRLHLDGQTIQLEPNLTFDNKFDQLTAHQWEKQSLYFGGVHSVFIKEDQLYAYGDERRHGYAIVRN